MQIDYEKAIGESIQVLQQKEQQLRNARVLKRIQMLRMLKSGQATTLLQASSLVGFSERQAQRIWQQYLKEGLDNICCLQASGSKEKLNDEQKQQLKQAAAEGNFASLWQACAYVEDEFGVSYTPSGMWYVFAAMKIKLKTARPVHGKQDRRAKEQFKKTLPTG